MILAALIAILGLYLLLVLLQRQIREALGTKLCAICGAVLVTWLVLFALWYFRGIGDSILIALLVGQSIAGVMYLFDAWARKNAKELLPLKIMIILFGTALAYSVLGDVHEPHGHTKLFLFFIVMLLLVVGYVIFTFEAGRRGKRGVLETKLEDCC